MSKKSRLEVAIAVWRNAVRIRVEMLGRHQMERVALAARQAKERELAQNEAHIAYQFMKRIQAEPDDENNHTADGEGDEAGHR